MITEKKEWLGVKNNKFYTFEKIQLSMIDKQLLFGNLNFKTISENPDFKEDSVREIIILPILYKLGYKQENIIRSKTLKHPF